MASHAPQERTLVAANSRAYGSEATGVVSKHSGNTVDSQRHGTRRVRHQPDGVKYVITLN